MGYSGAPCSDPGQHLKQIYYGSTCFAIQGTGISHMFVAFGTVCVVKTGQFISSYLRYYGDDDTHALFLFILKSMQTIVKLCGDSGLVHCMELSFPSKCATEDIAERLIVNGVKDTTTSTFMCMEHAI